LERVKGRWRDSGSGGVEVGRSASDDTSGGKPKGRKPTKTEVAGLAETPSHSERSACGRHAESYRGPWHLQLHASPLSGPVRFLATPLRSGFEAIAGRYPHPEPVVRTAFQRYRACFSPPLPFRPAALRIKAYSLSSPCKLAAVSVSGPFGNRSVNPGTVAKGTGNGNGGEFVGR